MTYPEGYADPPSDGTVAGFRDVVLPARIRAIEQFLGDALADLLPEGCRLEADREAGSDLGGQARDHPGRIVTR